MAAATIATINPIVLPVNDLGPAVAGLCGPGPINFLYGHLHNSIRAELDTLSSCVLSLEPEKDQELLGRLQRLKERYGFLKQVYAYHSSVEDEVVYPALDSKVKNVTLAYSVEHQDEVGRTSGRGRRAPRPDRSPCARRVPHARRPTLDVDRPSPTCPDMPCCRSCCLSS